MKNIDKIRQMTVDELAKLISSCKYCIHNNNDELFLCPQNANNCLVGIRLWLESEAE